MFCFVLFTAAAAVDMNEIKSLTVYKDLYSFFFCSEYMYVSLHIYKHLALFFFFCCCKVFSPLFTLTLLDHVVLPLPLVLLIQGKLKTDFGWSGGPSLARSCWEKNPGGRHQTPQKLSKRNQKIVFFFTFIWYFVYDFFLLFFVCFSRFVFISLRKTTNTYIQYSYVSFVFVLQ